MCVNITDIFDYTSDETAASSYLERHVKSGNEPMIPLNTLIVYSRNRKKSFRIKNEGVQWPCG